MPLALHADCFSAHPSVADVLRKEPFQLVNKLSFTNPPSATGGATTTGPDATYPPAICQNSGGQPGSGGGGVSGRGQGGASSQG